MQTQAIKTMACWIACQKGTKNRTGLMQGSALQCLMSIENCCFVAVIDMS
jgi:hypothetical protein